MVRASLHVHVQYMYMYICIFAHTHMREVHALRERFFDS